MTRRPDPRALAGLALAVLLHLGGFALLRALPGSAARERAPEPVAVQLLWRQPVAPRPATSQARERTATATRPAPSRMQPQSHPQPQPQPQPQPITLPPEVAAPPAAAASSALDAAAAMPRQQALDLSLPPEAASAPRPVRERALNDPRANTRQHSASERFAATLGTDLTERTTALNGGRRIRRGTSCVDVMDSRATQIDPYGPKWPGAVRSCD